MTDITGTINSQLVLLALSNTPEPHTGGISANDVIFDKSLQQMKAPSPMLATLAGNVSSVKPLQPLKALNTILDTLLGMKLFLHPAINVLVSVSIIELQLSRES